MTLKYTRFLRMWIIPKSIHLNFCCHSFIRSFIYSVNKRSCAAAWCRAQCCGTRSSPRAGNWHSNETALGRQLGGFFRAAFGGCPTCVPIFPLIFTEHPSFSIFFSYFSSFFQNLCWHFLPFFSCSVTTLIHTHTHNRMDGNVCMTVSFMTEYFIIEVMYGKLQNDLCIRIFTTVLFITGKIK